MVKKQKTEDEEQGQHWDEFYAKKKQITLYIFSITVATIAVFGALGYGLDVLLGTKPLCLILSIFISFPINLMIIHKKVKKDII